MSINEESVFAEALEKTDPQERAEFLDRACAGNAALRAGVESLLAAYPAGGFLEVPAAQRPLGEQGDRVLPNATEAEPASRDEEAISLEFLTPSVKPGSLGRLGHYEILEVIGRGGMGIVLRAFDDKLHRVVAIKVMSPELAATSPPRKRFLREARAAAAVRHEHVVDIHAVEEQPIPYLVMEYVPGETLQQKLDRVGPLETREVLRLGQQIARGLAAAHAQGLIHRDIKPSNILIEQSAEERVKITDFGLARAAADASLTQSGVIAGTPMYMAPEQTQGEAIDHRADLFSFGSMLYTMCSGRPPFRATTSMAVLRRVAEDSPRPIREIIPEVPEWLCDVIARLQAKKPEDRFQTAKEVADLLGKCLTEMQQGQAVSVGQAASLPEKPLATKEPEARPVSARQAGGLPYGKRRWAIAAAVLVCLLSGLSLTEATGVTNLRATVIHIFTPDGTLVVETNDSGVKVTIEGDGGMIITGAGPQEVQLRPGSYRVQADRDGKPVPLEKELVSIARGGREVLKVKLEASPVPPAAIAHGGAFVVLAGRGVPERKFNTLAEAIVGASDGDTIEVRGNGPFATAPIKIPRTALTIRAGAGYRPVIELSTQDSRAQSLLQADAPLVLEGLEFRRLEDRKPDDLPWRNVLMVSKALHAANCRFLTRQAEVHIAASNAAVAEVRNCEFLTQPILTRTGGIARPIALFLWPGRGLALDNCLLTAQVNAGHRVGDPRDAALRLTRNTFRSTDVMFRLSVYAEDDDAETYATADWTVKALRVEASGNLFGATEVIKFMQKAKKVLPPGDAEACLARMLDWQGERNAFSVDGEFVRLSQAAPWRDLPSAKLPAGLAGWKRLWGTAETDSVQGTARFEGGDILARLETAPEKLTPADVRLRPDSVGYHAGKDGKDLGADIDLLGPGPAYERWKKTPEYQQWLKDTKQVSGP